MFKDTAELIRLYLWYIIFILMFFALEVGSKCSALVQHLFNKKQQRKVKERKRKESKYIKHTYHD